MNNSLISAKAGNDGLFNPNCEDFYLTSVISGIFDSISIEKKGIKIVSGDIGENYFEKIPLIVTNKIFLTFSKNQVGEKQHFIAMLRLLFTNNINKRLNYFIDILSFSRGVIIYKEDIKLLFFHGLTFNGGITKEMDKYGISQLAVLFHDKAVLLEKPQLKAALIKSPGLFYLFNILFYKKYVGIINGVAHYQDNKNVFHKTDTQGSEHCDRDDNNNCNGLLKPEDLEMFKDGIKPQRNDNDTVENIKFINEYLITNSQVIPLYNAFGKHTNNPLTIQIILCNNVSIEFNMLSKINTELFIQFFSKHHPIKVYEDYYQNQEEILSEDNKSIVTCGNIQTNRRFVAKIIQKDNELKQYKWERDISYFLIYTPLDNIVPCYEVFDTIDTVILVYEKYKCNGNQVGGNGESLLSLEQVNQILKKIINGILNLNKYYIIHRDIKPENILINSLEDYEGVISDFGFCKVLPCHETTQESYGTICYACPEVVLNEPYNHSVDTWSLGVVAYYGLFGELPFDDPMDDLREIVKQIIENKYTIPKPNINENESIGESTFINNGIRNALQTKRKILWEGGDDNNSKN